jgi:sugar phosphate isomerase/epimerase
MMTAKGNQMEIKAFRHLWGYPISSDATYRKIRDDGYTGIEGGLIGIERPDDFRRALREYGLEFVGQVYTAEFTKGHTVAEHLRSLECEIEKLLPFEPVLINVHSGEDTWSIDEMHEYFDDAVKLQRRLSVPIAHETHRGRCLFHPTVTRAVLEAHGEIRIVADLSHWVCVCERLLEDQQAAIALAAERTVYVHARMGFSQGPQLSDPRSDQFAAERAAFESWWRIIYDLMRRRGMTTFSFCPEYGPPPYLPVLPFTGVPVTDLPTVCNWQAERVRELVRQWQ